jgi:hypothetical protein
MSNRHGSEPGERRGGRQPGSKNLATIERERAMTDGLRDPDRPLGKDVIAEAMMKFRELAEKHAALAVAAADLVDREAAERKFAHYLELMGEMGHKLAPFESPRFASLSYSVPKLNMTVYTDEEIDTLEQLLNKGTGIEATSSGMEDPTEH